MTYLDWASTSPPDASLLAGAAEAASQFYANPSSGHALGAAARAELERIRGRLAAALGAGPGRVVLTSGGSEADAIVLLSALRAQDRLRASGLSKRLRVVTTEIEHPAVHEQARLLQSLGLELVYLYPRADGRVDPAELAEAVTRETVLVAVMAVNNETGAVQPLAELARALAAASAALGTKPPRFHADAVQALGKLEFRPAELGISSAAFSAHKIRGPRGSGALWMQGELEPLAVGGGQEEGTRPGTESLQGAWAFAGAAEKALSSLAERREAALALEARLISGLASIPGALPLPLGRGPGDARYSPFILSAAFPGLSGEVLARALSDSGIAVSTGSACSSNARRKGRRVLEAMGLQPELAFSSIRVSWGELTGGGDIDAFLEAASTLYKKLKA
ncbi:MAG TPA: cysteine desulfurase family protein [Spirochaetales bacterium]|nr:cysteine desulfurase family protein [Spirochaetales bacterium]HRY56284.1 cysteine desulfurase family protein [Spirochaetia bacterium]